MQQHIKSTFGIGRMIHAREASMNRAEDAEDEARPKDVQL
jgi:hypothetical protein